MGTSNSSDDLKTIRAEAEKLIGQSIVSALLRKDYTIADFNQFFGSVAYYNQSGGNYTQTDGGNYTQNGGGNYTQSPHAMQMEDMIHNVEIIGHIRDTVLKSK